MLIFKDDWQHTFVCEWQLAWNDRNLEKILSFYHDGLAMTSPLICDFLGIDGFLCVSKKELKIFCEYIFANFPGYVIHVVCATFKGASITLHYHDCFSRLVTETMQFSLDRKVINSITY